MLFVISQGIFLVLFAKGHNRPSQVSPGRYVSIIQSNIESGPKMIQFNIQFKTKFEIFIQSKIHSKISLKYSIQNFIQEIGKK